MALSVGVELGPTSVRAVLLEQAGQTVTLRASQELPCETAQPDALTRALTQLRQTLPIRVPIVLGVPSTAAIVATVTPLVPNPSRPLLGLQFELQQHLPFELTEAVWHYRWLNGHRPGPTTQARAVVGAMKRALLEERLASCRRAGLIVKAVAINALATLNARSADAPAAGLDETAGLTLISDRDAEWLLVTPAGLRVVPIASVSPDALIADVAAAWEALRADRERPLARVWVTGRCDAWPALQHALASRGVSELQRYELPATVRPVGGTAASHAFVTAAGLALQSFGRGRFGVNLIQEAQSVQQVRQGRRLVAAIVGLSAAASVVLGASGMLALRQRRLQALASLQQQERLYQTLRPELRELLQRQQHLERRIQRMEQLAGQGSAVTQVLAQTAQLLPDDVWLTKLEYAKILPPAAQTEGIQGLLEGRAKSYQVLTALTDRLKGLAGGAPVKPLSTNVTTDAQTGKEVVAFAIQFQRP